MSARPRYLLTAAADADLEATLREGGRRFGAAQRARYAALVGEAARRVAERPRRPGSRPRDELGRGVRSYHVELAAERQGAASHVLFFREIAGGASGVTVEILRVLHERMDPSRHVHLTSDGGTP